MNTAHSPFELPPRQLRNCREMLLDLMYQSHFAKSDKFLSLIREISSVFPEAEQVAIKKLEEKLFLFSCDPERAEDLAEPLVAYALHYNQSVPFQPPTKPTA